MSRPKLFSVAKSGLNANVFIDQAKAFYDRTAKKGERVILLEGSILKAPDNTKWIYRDLEILAIHGYLERIGTQYRVKRPIAGSTSGTAAAVLGAGFKPAGFHRWKFNNGRSIYESGEK
ncbi:hypothetical protein [Cohnella yongneupensis]|uniref:Uncharacterized protein n=1 Tax=Cohnella yongneupensis TaxID=425006 RepID=A0ABW0QV76_9BACL